VHNYKPSPIQRHQNRLCTPTPSWRNRAHKLTFKSVTRRRGPLLRAKFHPHRCKSTCRPCGSKNLKIGMSKLNTGRFALRAMLPVIRSETGCARLAENTARKKSPSGHPIPQLCRAISSQGIDNRRKIVKQHLLHMSS